MNHHKGGGAFAPKSVMSNKFKLALVAAAALCTASAVYAGPHHWGNWGNPDCPYADGSGYANNGARYHGQRHHRGMGYGYGYSSGGQGAGAGMMGGRGSGNAGQW